MAKHEVQASELTEGEIVFVHGKVGYSHITRPVEGKELEAANARKQANGNYASNRPYTVIEVNQAEVQFKDPAAPTLNERFVAERMFRSIKYPEKGISYRQESRGTQIPVIAIPSTTEPGKFVQDESGQELARGLDVTVALRAYKPKAQLQLGLAIDSVVVNEEPRYFMSAGAANVSELAARGIVFTAPPRRLDASSATGDVPGIEEDDDVQPVAAPVVEQLPLPQPAAQQTTQAPRVPVQPVQPMAPVAPQPGAETPEQRIARLERENAMLKSQQDASAFGPVDPAGAVQPAPTTPDDPWAAPAGAITYQG